MITNPDTPRYLSSQSSLVQEYLLDPTLVQLRRCVGGVLLGLYRIGVIVYGGCDPSVGVLGGGEDGDGTLVLAITVLLITIRMHLLIP